MQIAKRWLWLIPALLLSGYLGTVMIVHDAIWLDEWLTHLVAGTGQFTQTTVPGTPCEVIPGNTHTFAHMLCMSAVDNAWPPLFFGLLMIWEWLVGFGAPLETLFFIDRAFVVLMGLVAVAIVYRMSRELFDHRTGLMAALLLGTSAFFTFYMHEIRGYMLYVILPALNGWFYWRLLNRVSVGKGIRWGFALSIAGTLYTHYVGTAVVAGIGIYHLLFARPPEFWTEIRKPDVDRSPQAQRWLTVFKLWFNGGLLFGIWLAVLLVSFYNETLIDRGVNPLELLQAMLYGFSNNLIPLALIALAASLLRWRERAVQFLWVWMLSILAVAILANIFASFLYHPRHITGMMPAFMTLIAVGLLRLSAGRHRIAFLIVGFWVGAGFVHSHSPDFINEIPLHVRAVPRPAMETILTTTEQCMGENDALILAINEPEDEWVQDPILNYYLSDYPVRYISISRIFDDEQLALTTTSLLPDVLETADDAARLQYVTENANRVWVFSLPHMPVEASLWDLDTDLLALGYKRCPVWNEQPDLLGRVYAKSEQDCQTLRSTCR